MPGQGIRRARRIFTTWSVDRLASWSPRPGRRTPGGAERDRESVSGALARGGGHREPAADPGHADGDSPGTREGPTNATTPRAGKRSPRMAGRWYRDGRAHRRGDDPGARGERLRSSPTPPMGPSIRWRCGSGCVVATGKAGMGDALGTPRRDCPPSRPRAGSARGRRVAAQPVRGRVRCLRSLWGPSGHSPFPLGNGIRWLGTPARTARPH